MREKPELVAGGGFDFLSRLLVSGSFELFPDFGFLGNFFCGFGFRHQH